MIVDTSAIIAIGNQEQGSEQLLAALTDADQLKISAANWVELGIVVDARQDPLVARRADNLLTELGVVIEPVTAEQAVLTRQAYRDFGKGRHAAGLNFGDCFAYALAKSTGEPLLFKGDDFNQTDVSPALP